VIDEPYEVVAPALQAASHWCDILILHLNIKQCRLSRGDTLGVAIGRKYEQPVEDAYPVEFGYKVLAADADYLKVALDADSGPFGTRAYSIALEATRIDAGRSFVHMSYSYEYGLAARLAMEAYLHTLGSGKVGFSVTGHRPDGQPIHVEGLRGVLERNAMRYFLAIDVYLDSLKAPAAQQVEQRLRDWYAGTERYATQLHELERDEYLEMKRREIARQEKPEP